ncbi:MAG: DUF169 domain-containing protein [Deltaproteobacteria bacterium]|nr:DUF169 domain-containing protein [Candidatus Anaeroferrophillus wilburensis]MBN2889254.1 DUF169 domain-containing protein [Deltaproteobacteria bacterium]
MDWKALHDQLDRLIRPASRPLGITILAPGEPPPKEALRPQKFGIRISLCQWTTVARRWGRPVAALAAEINCTPCLAALGLKQLKKLDDLVDYFMDMGYFADRQLAMAAAAEMELIPAGDVGGLLMFPLDQAVADPDVVAIYASPAQVARLVAGYVYHAGTLVRSASTGFGLSCLSLIKPHWTGKATIVHPGRGERVLAGTDEGELVFCCPAKELEQLVDGLQQTHKHGSRYPIQSYMLYEPPLLPSMKTLDDKLGISE